MPFSVYLGAGFLAEELGTLPGILLGAAVGLLVGAGLGLVSSKCFIHAKRLRAPSAPEILARDHRPPVVYFRPFTADADEAKTVTLTSWFTEEEQLAKIVKDIGPLVTIGAPGENLPMLGAARTYVDDSKWQEAALDLMRRAAIIMIRIGSSPGFRWEFETVVQLIKPERLVLLIPRDETLYEEFRRASLKLIPTVLPALTGWDIKKWFRGNLKAVIFFDSEWVPSIIDVQSYRLPFLRRSPATPLVPVLKTALRPIYENAGLRWTDPGIDRRWLGLLVCIAVIVAAPLALPELVNHLLFSSDAPRIAASDTTPPTTVPEPPRQSALEIAKQRFENRIQDLPEFASRLQAVIATGGGRDAGRAMGLQTKLLGQRRFDDDALLALADLQRKLLMQADIAACAALARGTAGSGVFPILGSLSPADIDQYFELSYEAVKAELQQSPAVRKADDARIQETSRIIIGALSEEERERLKNAVTNGNDEDTCWAERTMQAAINKLDRADRVQWVLFGMQPQ